MTIDPDLYRCRVCGVSYAAEDEGEDGFLPWGEDGKTASFDICVCCGAQFGYEDFVPAGILAHRRKWLDAGGRWRDPKFCPPAWSLAEQLRCIPAAYREEVGPRLGTPGPAGPGVSRDT